MALFTFTLNGEPVTVDCDGSLPLLWVLRDVLGLTGTKYGCAIMVCNACNVLLDGAVTKTCGLAVQGVAGRSVVTVEGLDALPNGARLRQAWIDEQVPQCGYCQSGFLCRATALLNQKARPTAADIAAMPNICVCGTYQRITDAILVASGQEPRS